VKHLKTTMAVAIAIASLYLLQSCGGANYNAYVADHQDIAMNEMERTGYPASIKLAQAILESEGGRGKLAFEYNNHFGITCGKNWPGKKYYQEEEDFNGGEILETCYRVYNNPYSSFIAHTDLLRTSNHYKVLFKLDPSDYVGWAKKLNELGYTDNDTYDNTLISMIEKYELYQFDDMVTGKSRSTASRIDAEEEYQKDRNPQRKRPLNDRYKEKIEELEEDIKARRPRYAERPSERWSKEEANDHKSTYQEDRRFDYDNYARDVDAYQEDDYYTSTEYEDQEAGYYEEEESTYQERPNERSRNETTDRYSRQEDFDEDRKYRRPRTYDDLPPTRTRRTNSSTNIDDKYEGLGDMYGSSSANTSRNSTYKERYEEAPARRSRTESWEEPIYETSIADFAAPEDYAYINDTKVTAAHYDDTPLLIAARYNVSVKDILKYNEDIKNSKQLLREGTKVFLEPKKKHYEGVKNYHDVQFGERMKDIAQLYGLSLSALYEKNRMPENSEPALGERIKLDRGKAKRRPELRAHYRSNYASPEPVIPANRPSTPPKRVAIKESPSKIIKTQIVDNYPNNLNTTQQTNLTTVLLQPVTTKIMHHRVKEGETLYGIARQHHTTAEVIRSMNNLKGNTISRGMLLKVR